MSIANIGIGSGDFINNILADFGETVSIAPVTEVEDFRGNLAKTYTGTYTATVIVHVRKQDQERDEKGIRILQSGYIIHRTDSGIKEGDKIIVGTGTGTAFKVHTTTNRRDCYQYSDLYLWE